MKAVKASGAGALGQGVLGRGSPGQGWQHELSEGRQQRQHAANISKVAARDVGGGRRT